jgi:hypothetical protein
MADVILVFFPWWHMGWRIFHSRPFQSSSSDTLHTRNQNHMKNQVLGHLNLCDCL